MGVPWRHGPADGVDLKVSQMFARRSFQLTSEWIGHSSGFVVVSVIKGGFCIAAVAMFIPARGVGKSLRWQLRSAVRPERCKSVLSVVV